MKSVRFIALAALLVSAGGCVSTDDVEKLQSQINELQEEVANLKRTASSKDEVQNVNQRIAEQAEQLLRSNATLVAKVDQMSTTVQSIQGTVEQSTNRVDRLGQQLTQAQRDVDELKRASAAAAAAAQVPAPGAAAEGGGTPQNPASSTQMTVPVGATDDPAQVYQEAYRDYQRGNFDLAIAGFQDFLKSSPNSDLADNAAYWIAESLFSQKKYRDAIEQFDNVVTRYPRSDKVPGSLLKKGYAYISIGERSQGVVQLQYVVHEHPTSQEAALARQRLRQLGIETR
jgi:tol-pal system protein YbgF